MNRYSNRYIDRRRFYLIIFFLFLCVFLFIPDNGYGQTIATEATEYRLWYSGFDARSTAMAKANVADHFDINGIYTNPATLVFSNNSPSVISNSLYNSSRSVLLENFTASLIQAKFHRMVGAATVQSSLLNKDPLLSPEQLQFTQIDLTMGYSWLLFQSLSAGFTLNSLYGNTATSKVWTYNASLGFLYAPSSLVSYGLVYRGTGINEGWLGSQPVYQLTDENETTAYSVHAPHRLEIGLTLRFPSLVRYPDLVLSLSNEKIFGIDGLIYKGGIEIHTRNILALRGGYFYSPFASGSRLGFGLLFDEIKLDYAYAPTNIDLNGSSHQLSISLNL